MGFKVMLDQEKKMWRVEFEGEPPFGIFNRGLRGEFHQVGYNCWDLSHSAFLNLLSELFGCLVK